MAASTGFNLTTTGFSTTLTNAIYRNLIALLRTQATYAIPESIVPLARVPGNNRTAKVTVWTDVPPVLAALAEGVPPTATSMANDSMTFTVTEQGSWIPIWSQSQYEAYEDLVAQAAMKIARMQYLHVDTFVRTLYEAAAVDVWANPAHTTLVTTAVGDVLTTARIREAVTLLRERDVPPFADGFYRIVGSPRLFVPLMAEAATNGTFAQAAAFGTVGDLKEGVIGEFAGAKFISAGSRGTKYAGGGAAGIDVYRAVAFGQQAVALTDLSSIENTVYPGGGPTDPLHQLIATVGYRMELGGGLVKLANFSDGAGNLSTQIQRSVVIEGAAA